jgi:predicted small secreted protein
MKRILLPAIFLIFTLTSCNGWSYTVPTFPAPPPTITPSIFSPTPVIFTITTTTTSTPLSETLTDTPEIPTETATAVTPSETATAFTEAPTSTDTPTLPPVSPNIVVEVSGCNTSIDITHGMGEVTNAYVILKNNTGNDLSNLCATLNALDEGRVHPDKTVCVPSLANGQQVTLKLTVDSTYKENTPIQVEVKSGDTLLSRIGQTSCTDIGLFAPKPESLLTPIPIQ